MVDAMCEGLSHDRASRLLSHSYRRALLVCLDRHDGVLALSEAAESVASETRDRESARTSSPEEIKRVYMSLYHTHVPKLSDVTAVRYDQRRDAVLLTDRGVRLVDRLERCADHEFE